ncbi:carboxylesterase [Bdellovibrio bacteriovorus]|uniref:Carboxylesterase n=1 Tax=Bdellovibrio bacteriovorus TaxID=959 RepID=A0A162GXY4_BDEBC|nr:alpha/beta hydrolase [Bdellovibrio bacteriovorus]KYG69190.1 carboxylesterase [Bdellovibrio bacteriovorus]
MIHVEVKPGLVPENVFFIHGNLASNRWWLPSEEIWKKEAQGKNYQGSLIYAEFRGCGGSTPPKSSDEVNMHLFAEDFIEVVRSLKKGPVHLVGHSTGGLIASLMMAKAPELFGKAILLDSVGAQGVTFDTSMITAFEQMKQDKNLTGVVLGSTIHNNNPESKFFKDVLVEDAFHAVKTVGHWVLQALDGLDIREEIQKIKNEVLVLHGEHDKLLPMSESEALASLFSRGKFQVIEGLGHCPNIESPEKFVSITRNFLFQPL